MPELNEFTIIKRSYQLIKKDFGLEESGLDELQESDSEWLLNQLTLHVNHLLDTDLNRLMNALYRIDIPESQVKELLTLSKPEGLAREISKAILEREQQKVITRHRYRQ